MSLTLTSVKVLNRLKRAIRSRKQSAFMKISKASIRALERPRLPGFEERLVKQLQQSAPLESENLGDDIRPIIREGMRRAERHGLSTRGSVQLYIELMFLLGFDFDSDPQFPWAIEVLEMHDLLPDKTRNKQDWLALDLYHQTIHFMDRVGGPDQEFHRASLHRVRNLTFDVNAQRSRSDFDLLELLANLHPERFAYAGEDCIRPLIAKGRESAERLSISSADGELVVIVLMFLLGHGILTDPIYPFIRSTIENLDIADADERVERLHAKTMLFVDRTLEIADPGHTPDGQAPHSNSAER